MPIIIEKIDMPSECQGCIFEDRVGGCIILNKTGACGKSYEEYDDEWFKARKEHRRLKWCPLKIDFKPYPLVPLRKISVWSGRCVGYACPKCDADVVGSGNFCWKCGQALDWGK